MNNKKLIFITLCILFIPFLIILINGLMNLSPRQIQDRNFENTIKNKLDNIMNPKINKADLSSSNPYIYIENNKDYAYIIKMGKKAVGYMANEIKNSPNNGLREHIMAIACSEILGEQEKTWSNGKEWYNQYKLKVHNN